MRKSDSSQRLLRALLALSLVSQWHNVHASVSVPFVVHSPSIDINTNSKAPGDAGSFSFQNINDATGADVYVAAIKVGNQNYVVQLDTGSSDLWLDTSKVSTSQFTSTGLGSSITYGDGTVAQGPILIGSAEFGGFSVQQQAFISAPGSNATTNGDTGLLGVGPPLLSQINDALQGSQFNGKTLLENIFDANPSEPNQITFLLSRSQTTGTTSGGIFTIGEVAPSSTLSSATPDTSSLPTGLDLQNVTNQVKLPVVSSSRWVVLMDGILVNGEQFNGGSQFRLDGQTSGQTLANLDTGTSLAVIPFDYARVIYGNIPGAQFSRDEGIYIIPCDTRVNLSFVFGGVEYPVHPIDAVSAALDNNGEIICFSGFPVGDAGNSEDLLLGDSFLRNTYSLFDFGSFISTTSTSPFIQLLSITDRTKADAEFQAMTAQRNESLKTGSGSVGNGGGSGSGGQGNAAGSMRVGGEFGLSVVCVLVGLVALVSL